MRTVAVAVALAAVACTVPPPFHVLETPQTLKAKQVSVLAGAGGGTGDRLNACCGGAAARARIGIGDDQEVGIDGDLVFSKDTVIGGFKAAYKVQTREHLAFVVGPGVMFGGDSGQRSSIGGDVGMIASTDIGTNAMLYGAVRVAFAMPVLDAFEIGGLSEALVLPVGIAYPIAPRLRLFGELGGIGALTQARDAMGTIQNQTGLGFYGALAVSFTP